MTDKQIIQEAQNLIDEFLKLLEIEALTKLSMEVDDDDSKFLKVAVEGEDLGNLIGYKGNTLSALQTIFAQILSKETKEAITVMLDINGYREKRKKYLQSLALRACEEAKESKQNVELPPLSSFERRVVHMTLKNEKGITTESEGEGEERHVVVKVK
jgi:spoIIIJ-associated protein